MWLRNVYPASQDLFATFIGPTIEIKKGQRIAQMALRPVYYFSFEEVDKLSETERNEKGFGSTGGT